MMSQFTGKEIGGVRGKTHFTFQKVLYRSQMPLKETVTLRKHLSTFVLVREGNISLVPSDMSGKHAIGQKQQIWHGVVAAAMWHVLEPVFFVFPSTVAQPFAQQNSTLGRIALSTEYSKHFVAPLHSGGCSSLRGFCVTFQVLCQMLRKRWSCLALALTHVFFFHRPGLRF